MHFNILWAWSKQVNKSCTTERIHEHPLQELPVKKQTENLTENITYYEWLDLICSIISKY